MTTAEADVRREALEARKAELLTVKEYAFLMSEHPDSVRRRIRHGRQPGAVVIGGQWRIDLARAENRSTFPDK